MYNPYQQFSNPQQYSPQYSQQQNNSLLRVTGYEGAKAFQMMPNSSVALFDANQDVFYIKSSDAGGFSTIKAYSFTEYSPTEKKVESDLVTRSEFESKINELKETMKQYEQHIQKSSTDGKQYRSDKTV